MMFWCIFTILLVMALIGVCLMRERKPMCFINIKKLGAIIILFSLSMAHALSSGNVIQVNGDNIDVNCYAFLYYAPLSLFIFGFGSAFLNVLSKLKEEKKGES